MSLEFKPITLEAKEIIEGYTKGWNLECSDLSFTNLFIWGANKKMEYAEWGNCLYIKLDYEKVPVYLWTPIPYFGVEVDYRKAVDQALDYMREIGTEPTLRSVWTPFKDLIKECYPELYISSLEIAWDYIYKREDLATLKGKKFHGKRNHINRFLRENPNYEYKSIDSSMIEECMRVYDEWSEEKDEASITLFDERLSVSLALNNMEALGLTGGCLIIDGEIVAFTLGERLLPYMQLIHIEKAKMEIDGLYPMINQQYILHECKDVTLINREEDMGLEGMRKAKRSYHPIKMVEKYFISVRDLSNEKGIWLE